MKKSIRVNNLIVVLFLLFSSYIKASSDEALLADKSKSVNEKPLVFMENKGQIIDAKGNTRQDILFSAKGNGLKMYLKKSGITYLFVKGIEGSPLVADEKKGKQFQFHRVEMRLVGANPNPMVTKEEKGSYYENYYLPHCGDNGIKDVGSYNKLTYKNIYPNIDWIIYTKGKSFKYDFVVHPNGNPKDIKIEYGNITSLDFNSDGGLDINSSMGKITEEKPYTYQDSKGIESAFKLTNNLVSFEIGSYNPTKNLVIDPGVYWGTFYGSTEGEGANSCTADAQGNVYLVGQTYSNDLCLDTSLYTFSDLYAGNGDAFIAKFDASGNLLWTSYYGGSDFERPMDCKPEAFTDWVYMVGETTSSNLFTSNAFQPNYAGNGDGFVADFDGNGYLSWSSYLGDAGNDAIHTVDVDPTGAVYFAGKTSSLSGIASGSGYQQTHSPAYLDAFLVKYDFNWNKQWGSYLGGDADTYANGICAVSDSSAIFMIGTTFSTTGLNINSATGYAGNGDAFITRWDMNTGQVVVSNYMGGPGLDEGNAISGHNNFLNVFGFSGTTNSSIGLVNTGQLTLGGGTDAFFGWMSYDLLQNQVSYFGGSGNEKGLAVAFRNGNVCIGGSTSTSTGLTTSNALQSSFGGNVDAYFASFAWFGLGSVFISYYGDWQPEEIVALEFAPNTDLLTLAGTANGQGGSNQGIVYGNAFQTMNRGDNANNAFLALVGVNCATSPNTISISTNTGSNAFCQGEQFILNASGASNLQWTNGPSGNSYQVTAGGMYEVSGTQYGCPFTQQITVTLNPLPSVTVSPSGAQFVCQGDNLPLLANSTTAVSYQWYLDGDSIAGQSTDSIGASVAGSYTVEVTNNFGCRKLSNPPVLLFVNSAPSAVITAVGSTDICAGATVTLNANNAAVSYQWLLNGSPISGATSNSYSASATGNYSVREVSPNTCDSTSNEIGVVVYPYPTSNISYTGVPYTCLGNSVGLNAVTDIGTSYQWLLNGSTITGATSGLYAANASGEYTVSITGAGNCSTLSGIVELNPVPEPTQLCFATIDTAYGGDTVVKLFWQKPAQAFVKGYVIYREIAGQGFVAIDTVSNTLFSSYSDSTANPTQQSERYKITTLDSCGSSSDISLSTVHQTILLQGSIDVTGSTVNLDWDAYLGITDPTRFYRIMRDNLGNGVWDSIGATPWSISAVNSGFANLYPNANYAVDLVWQGTCTASQRVMAGYSSSRSNIKNKNAFPVGSKKLIAPTGLSIYPNPAQKQVTVEFNLTENNAVLYLTDVLGRRVLENQLSDLKGKTKIQLNLEEFSPGVYSINLQSESNNTIQKLVIE